MTDGPQPEQRVSGRSIGRLIQYRRALRDGAGEWGESVYSHQLAAACRVSAAQVRRDLMTIGYKGTSSSGYQITHLLDAIDGLLDGEHPVQVALVGVGYLGSAVLGYLFNRPKLSPIAAFDIDPKKTDRVIQGVRCYPLEQLAEILRAQNIELCILTVPASEAQRVADLLVAAGVRGILNFTPAVLHVPRHVFVESRDMTESLERVAFFARRSGSTTRKDR